MYQKAKKGTTVTTSYALICSLSLVYIARLDYFLQDLFSQREREREDLGGGGCLDLVVYEIGKAHD